MKNQYVGDIGDYEKYGMLGFLAKPAYWQNKDAAVYYPDMVEAIIFEVGGFFQGLTTVTLKKNYYDHHVLDGAQWGLEIKLNGRRRRTYSGSNAYPPYWKELIALFRLFARL